MISTPLVWVGRVTVVTGTDNNSLTVDGKDRQGCVSPVAYSLRRTERRSS